MLHVAVTTTTDIDMDTPVILNVYSQKQRGSWASLVSHRWQQATEANGSVYYLNQLTHTGSPIESVGGDLKIYGTRFRGCRVECGAKLWPGTYPARTRCQHVWWKSRAYTTICIRFYKPNWSNGLVTSFVFWWSRVQNPPPASFLQHF